MTNTGSKNFYIKQIIKGILLLFIPLITLNLLTSFDFQKSLLRFFFVLATLILAKFAEAFKSNGKLIVRPIHFLLTALVILSFLGAIKYDHQLSGWIFLTSFFAFLLSFAASYSKDSAWKKYSVTLLLALIAGFIPVVSNQIAIRFSEEEFYTSLMILGFAFFWLSLYFVFCHLQSVLNLIINIKNTKGRAISRGLVFLGILSITTLVAILGLKSYQASFYPKEELALFGTISNDNPFICGQIDPAIIDEVGAASVQDHFSSRLTQKEELTLNDLGFLAIYNNSEEYANLYKSELLTAAENGLYTTPAESVKYDQYLASQTIYFYNGIRTAFPELFSPSQIHAIENWVGKINQRAQTVEWVDWLYGLAFSKLPVGAYENQEIGAGLYAQLLHNGLASGKLAEENIDYLNNIDSGWNGGFRVLDDSINYQPVWINNAYFQWLFNNQTRENNLAHSFEWVLSQALPDASIMAYNFPHSVSLAPVSLLGAKLLNDGRYLWLAEQAMDSLDNPNYLNAQPGVEKSISTGLKTEIPQIGSCLIYGDSGLPGQKGPLAPDKIVFRSGWEKEDLYLLLNLRFSGWHRYKASNAISLVYAGRKIVEERYTQDLIPWLPIGRAMVRDKRIPIDQLNTLLIKRDGLDAVLNTLIDWYGPYAQDPPFYADIEDFQTSKELDYSRTVLNDWHGWDFEREIYFYHNGPVFVVDRARSIKKESAIITWHLSDGYKITDENRSSNPDTHVDLLWIGKDNGILIPNDEDGGLPVQYQSPQNGELFLITVFLPDEWRQAELLGFLGDSIILSMGDDEHQFKIMNYLK